MKDELYRKIAAWAKAQAIAEYDSAVWRRDCDGRYIKWEEYGQYTQYGWHIDHILPSSIGGSDDTTNLRARHWQGNTSAGGLLGNHLK